MGKKIERQTFKINDRVFWASQAAGSWTKKEGVVHRVIPAGQFCHLTSDEVTNFSCQVDSSSPRDHENYLVLVPGRTENSKSKIYRPVVSRLKKV